MYLIPLTSVPNQSLAFNVDGAYWKLHVYLAATHMCVDVTRNGEAVVNGVRCFGGIALMQYGYLHLPNFGNFIFDSDADWTLFGTSCNLYYLTIDEFVEFQGLAGLAGLSGS